MIHKCRSFFMQKCGYVLVTALLVLSFSSAIHAQEKLTLDDCIKIALKNNSQLRNANRDVEMANSGITQAYSNILPQLDMSLNFGKRHQGEVSYLQDVPTEYESYTIYNPVYDTALEDTIGIVPQKLIGGATKYEQRLVTQPEYDRKSNGASLTLQQPLFDGGNWWNQIKKSKANQEALTHQRDAEQQDVILIVRRSYFDLLKQMALLKVYQESENSYEEHYKRSQSMYEIGSVALADVYKARVSYGEAKTQVIQQKNIAIFAKYKLNTDMGRDPRTGIEIEDADFDSDIHDYTEAEIEEALSSQPELAYYQASEKTAEFDAKIARASYLPTIGIQASYTRFSDDYKKLYKNFDQNYNWYVGGGLNWNLFNGFADKANRQIQKLNHLKSQENLLEQQRLVRSSIEQARLMLRADQELIMINEENLVSAKEDLRLAQERYRIGSGTLLDVLEAQVSVTRSQTNLVSAQYDVLTSYAELQKALGILK